MRMLDILDSRILLPGILCALVWSAGASQSAQAQQPCTPGGNSNQNPGQAAQQLLSAVNNLKSAFGGKSSQAANATQPCAPAPTATPVSMSSAGSAAPQASAADSKAPIPPTVPYGSSLIPPAPASGLDPSKLPDLLGIHIGGHLQTELGRMHAHRLPGTGFPQCPLQRATGAAGG